MKNPDDLIMLARDWLGTPFHHQGRSRAGVDCVGVIILPAQLLGLQINDMLGYSHQPHGILQHEIAKQLVRINICELAVGDVLLMQWDEPQHVALVTNIAPLTVLHAFAQVRKVIEHELDPFMQKRITGVFRFKEYC